MRLGEALAMCPRLVLVEEDPSAAEQAWEGVLLRLEDSGFSVESAEPGCAYFETRGVERLYGGLEEALKRALASAGTGWDARIGAAERRFAALAAANVARAGQALVVSDEQMPRLPGPAAALAAAARRAAPARAPRARGQTIGRACRAPQSCRR